MTIPNSLIKAIQLFKQKRYAYAMAAAGLVLVISAGFVLANRKPSEQKPAAAAQTSKPQAEVAADTIVADTTVPQTSSTSTTTPSTPQVKPTAAQPRATAASTTTQPSQTTAPASTSTTPPAAGGTATPKPVPFGIAGTNNIGLAVGGSQQGTLATTDKSTIAWQPGGETTMWVGYGPEKPFAPAFLYLHGTPPGYTGSSIAFHVEATATATPGTVLQFYVHVSDPARGIDRIHTIYVTIQ